MLGFLFPPRALERLVANAARRTGQTRLAEALRSSSTTAPSSAPASARASFDGASGGSLAGGTGSAGVGSPVAVRDSFDARAALAELPPPEPGSSRSAGASPLGAAHPSPPGLPPLGASPPPRGPPSIGFASPGRGAALFSPFAAQASSAAAALSGAATPPAGTATATALLRQASRGSGAAAVLRQLSLQSGDLAHLLPDTDPLSPRQEEGAPARAACLQSCGEAWAGRSCWGPLRACCPPHHLNAVFLCLPPCLPACLQCLGLRTCWARTAAPCCSAGAPAG